MKYIITENQFNLIDESLFGNDSCSPDKINAKNWQELYSQLVKNKLIKKGEKLLIVWGPTQTLYYTQDGKTLTKTTRVSTGSNGFGNDENNKRTPKGLLKIEGKITGKLYEVLVSKTATGKILGPNKPSNRVDKKTGKTHYAEVLTGILELDGLESCNDNAFSRNIYFHGTNFESQLGRPASNGCIRVSNSEIQWLLGNIAEGTKVYIKP
jgi:lipoprotein-anchoring transpeptidase ErfK/SrfK